MRWQSTTLLGAAALVLASCAAHDAPGVQETTPSSSSSSPNGRARVTAAAPVIAKLRTRDRELTVFGSDGSGPAGQTPTFLVSNLQGATVAPRLSESELADAFPELHELYQSAVVEAQGLDASVDLQRFERDGRQEVREHP